MTQKHDETWFGEVLEWRTLLYISSILVKLFGKPTCNAIFFMLGVAEGCKIISSLLQKPNPSVTEDGLDLHEVFRELSKTLIENNYVEKFWFFESNIPGSNVKEYHVRVSNNFVLSILLEHDRNTEDHSLFCSFMRGLLKPIFVKLLGDGVFIIENECQLKNKQFCEYVIKKM